MADVHDLGAQVLHSTSTRHYQVTLDYKRASASMPSVFSVPSGTGVETADVWVDDAGRTRKLSLSYGGGALPYRLEFEIWDFGLPLEIHVPGPSDRPWPDPTPTPSPSSSAQASAEAKVKAQIYARYLTGGDAVTLPPYLDECLPGHSQNCREHLVGLQAISDSFVEELGRMTIPASLKDVDDRLRAAVRATSAVEVDMIRAFDKGDLAAIRGPLAQQLNAAQHTVTDALAAGLRAAQAAAG